MSEDMKGLDKEYQPAEVIMLDTRKAAALLSRRAPCLVEQYAKTPDALGRIVSRIDNLDHLPLVPDTPAAARYPLEALLGMHEAVDYIARTMSLPVPLVAQSALGLANAVIQGLVDVSAPGKPHPVPCSLFFLSAAASGEGKTLTDSILQSGLRELAYETDRRFMDQRQDYELALKAYHAESRKIENNRKLDQHQREVELKQLKRPQPPVNPRLSISDFTIEGLSRAYRNGCTRLSVMTDEGSTIYEGHTYNNDRRTAVMGRTNELWDGKPWTIDRSNGDGSFSLHGRRLAMSVTTQPRIMKNLLADAMAHETGFLARYLLAMPESCISCRTMQDINWQHIPEVTTYWHMLATLYQIQPATRSHDPLALQPRTLAMAPDARSLYLDYGNRCFVDAEGAYAPVRAATLKAGVNAARLAATLAVWNDPGAPAINYESMEAACYLMDWYKQEALRIAEFCTDTSDDSEISMAADLLAWLKQEERYLVHSRYLTQHTPRRAMRKSRTVDSLMSLLVEHGHAITLDDNPVIDGKPRQKAWLIVS